MSIRLEIMHILSIKAFRGTFLLVDVAMAMYERKVALTWAPSLKGRSPLQQWIDSQLKMLPAMPAGHPLERCLQQILDICVDDFRTQYSNLAFPNLSRVLAQEISRDLQTFQRQQWVADNHRRFVVVGHSGPEPPDPNFICDAVCCP